MRCCAESAISRTDPTQEECARPGILHGFLPENEADPTDQELSAPKYLHHEVGIDHTDHTDHTDHLSDVCYQVQHSRLGPRKYWNEVDRQRRAVRDRAAESVSSPLLRPPSNHD